FTILSFALLGVIIFQSCKKDDTNDTPQEFVADNSTFSNFMSWPIDATADGADPALGGAHAGNDSTVKRNVYFQNGQNRVNGVYPIGTLIVKHTKNPDLTVDEYTAMAKRGNNFSPTGGDWEFFVLKPDGSIATDGNGNVLRGSTGLMNGMCLNCHSAASSKDYIFSKN
ncbi:MAG TPA: hypothetical protein VIN10_07790, partial [Bacteroidales bacterium]